MCSSASAPKGVGSVADAFPTPIYIVTCHACGEAMRADPSQAGHYYPCRKCKTTFGVPALLPEMPEDGSIPIVTGLRPPMTAKLRAVAPTMIGELPNMSSMSSMSPSDSKESKRYEAMSQTSTLDAPAEPVRTDKRKASKDSSPDMNDLGSELAAAATNAAIKARSKSKKRHHKAKKNTLFPILLNISVSCVLILCLTYLLLGRLSDKEASQTGSSQPASSQQEAVNIIDKNSEKTGKEKDAPEKPSA